MHVDESGSDEKAFIGNPEENKLTQKLHDFANDAYTKFSFFWLKVSKKLSLFLNSNVITLNDNIKIA